MKKLIVGIVLMSFIIGGLSSCRTGYGCRGNQSWDKMVRRNNRFN